MTRTITEWLPALVTISEVRALRSGREAILKMCDPFVKTVCIKCKYYWQDLKFCFIRKEFTFTMDFKVRLGEDGRCLNADIDR